MVCVSSLSRNAVIPKITPQAKAVLSGRNVREQQVEDEDRLDQGQRSEVQGESLHHRAGNVDGDPDQPEPVRRQHGDQLIHDGLDASGTRGRRVATRCRPVMHRPQQGAGQPPGPRGRESASR